MDKINTITFYDISKLHSKNKQLSSNQYVPNLCEEE